MNESKTPQRPRGPPPPRAPAGRPPPPMDANQMARPEIKKPPGPPPGIGIPIAKLKPPPMAPPMGFNQPRPVASEIDLSRGLIESKGDKAQPGVPMDGIPGRGPPRPLLSVPVDIPEAGYGLVGTALKSTPKFNSMAQPKYSSPSLPLGAAGLPPRQAKPGAIAMFENPDSPNPSLAESKASTSTPLATPLGRAPRPPAPTMPIPGIPAGQPLPPDSKPPAPKAPPAPTRPAPNRGRLPPEDEPPDAAKKKLKPMAPTEEPPFKRKFGGEGAGGNGALVGAGKGKEMIEFEESSDEDEEEEKSGTGKSPNKLQRQDVSSASAGAAATKASEAKIEDEKKGDPVTASPPVIAPPASPALGSGSSNKAASPGALAAPAMPSFAPSPVGEEVPMIPLATSSSKSAPVKAPEGPSTPVSKASKNPPSLPPANDDENRKRSIAKSSAFVKPELMGIPLPGLPETAPGTVRSETVSKSVPRPLTRGPPDATVTSADINGGRFSIRCIEGIDIVKPYQTVGSSRLDPYLKFKLGFADRLPWVQTQTRRKQDSNPNFQNEIVTFDVIQPANYIYNNDILLYIELWSSSAMKDEPIANLAMSVIRIFQHPYVAYKEILPLQVLSGKAYNGKLVLEFSYEEARPGMLVCTLYEGRGLRSLDALGQQDPYVQFSLGDVYTKKSKVIKGGGKEPYFEEEDILLWVDKDLWMHDVVISVCDEQIGTIQPMGTTKFSPLNYMDTPPSKAQQEVFELTYVEQAKRGESNIIQKGELVLKVTFLPAGKLTVKCIKGKNLLPPSSKAAGIGAEVRMDPYVTITMEGQAAKIVKRSITDKDGGSDPVWDCDVEFDVVDQYVVDIEVFDQDLSGTDILLGTTQLSLLPVFKAGRINLWSTLRLRREGFGVKETGDVNFALSFFAPANIAYPQHRKDIDSFDDTLRALAGPTDESSSITALGEGAAGSLEKAIPIGAADEVINKLTMTDQPPPEFTEDEIVAAFRFIDLDHNNFVGAAEIRHILVCMGELITDEEIDMMITMVDSDGDGQVSLSDFRALVLHPNPGEVDMQAHAEAEKQKMRAVNAKPLTGITGKGNLDAVAYQRQKELTLRETKKKMLMSFIEDNDTVYESLTKAFSLYENLSKEKKVNARINFETFCMLLKVEPIGEYVRLFGLFDPEEQGQIDLREFILSIMNFVQVDKEERVRFSFQMFDETKSGYISQREVEEILKGNHMMGLASVQRKAQTVMKQAAANTSGAITLQEFIVVSKKFPNIILPSFNQIGATGQGLE